MPLSTCSSTSATMMRACAKCRLAMADGGVGCDVSFWGFCFHRYGFHCFSPNLSGSLLWMSRMRSHASCRRPRCVRRRGVPFQGDGLRSCYLLWLIFCLVIWVVNQPVNLRTNNFDLPSERCLVFVVTCLISIKMYRNTENSPVMNKTRTIGFQNRCCSDVIGSSHNGSITTTIVK